ncbi:MAG: hypothetical protein ACXWLH_03380 [Candidatus Saccharimonadales bacterium]
MKQIGQYNGDEAVTWLKRQTPLGLVLKFVGLLIAIMVVTGILGFARGWWDTAVKVVSPENVTKQWKFAYSYDKSLTASAQQWCSVKGAEVQATDPDERSQRTSQRLAIELNYSRIQAQYDAALANAFEAKYVKPPDVPRTAPTLQDKTEVLCPKVMSP